MKMARCPLESLPLKEHQHVRVTVSDLSDEKADLWLDDEYMGSVDDIEESEPTLEEVHRILAKIPGNLSVDIRAERDSRG
jgi:hypothetical protein